ncbi:MAG: DUF2723 domain-containing protein [Oscillochloridaceae bacterium]|nr:DUF2723 domain-containing protein [Chloroflexaceae bacterium]MDW8391227.1 DUF2723 domain-containing protein [Oscillochloridaceae bacterium]
MPGRAEPWYTTGVMRRYTTILLIPALLFAALYLLTLTRVHTFDALSYILDVDRKPWRELFHPHHLAYGPLGAAIRQVALYLGWEGSAEWLLQATNAVAGGLGVGLFAALLARLTGRWQAAAPGALLLGASYAYWYYAVEVEVYTIAALFLIAALWLMLELARRPAAPLLALGLGAIQGLAVLFHQTNALLSLPALVALGMGLRAVPATSTRSRAALALLLAYAAPLALLAGGAYLWVGLGVSGFRSWEALFRWAAGYTTTGYWGGPVDGARLALLGQGLARTIAHPGGALIGLALLATLALNARRLACAPQGALAITVTWLAIYGAFFLWWEPENIEFWIASLPPFYLLVVLAAYLPVADQPLPRFWPAVLLVCGLALLPLNGIAIIRRGDASRDLQRVTAEALAAHSTPGDLLIVPDGVLELYLPFYVERPQAISLNQAMTAAGVWPAACAWLRARIETAQGAGYAVLIAADAIRPLPAPPGEPPTPAERMGVDPETVAECYAPLQPALAPLDLGPGLPAYYRLPAAQELAEGPGWDFTRGRWGWRVSGAAPVSSPLPGLALRPERDPALTSPPLRLDPARFAALEVRLAADTAARDAQLFFLDSNGRADESRSLRWTLEPGPAAHTYRLNLRAAPGWEGVITGLRLDPVSVGDGGTVVVEWLRLEPR